jgi:hypothetical protein
MTRMEYTLRCDNCGVEITWAALVRVGADKRRLLHYCCEDCLAGQPCCCGERMELEAELPDDDVSHLR